MNVELDALEVRDNEDARRYEAAMAGKLAFIQYQREGDQIIFVHTEVPTELEGHGVATKMARFALDDARSRHLAVIPLCPYVASFIRRHPEYADLVPESFRQRVMEGASDTSR